MIELLPDAQREADDMAQAVSKAAQAYVEKACAIGTGHSMDRDFALATFLAGSIAGINFARKIVLKEQAQ